MVAEPSPYTQISTPGVPHADSEVDAKAIWPSSVAWLGRVAQWVVVAAMAVYVFGQITFFTPTYTPIKVAIGKWWGVPESVSSKAGGGGGGPTPGHNEMIRPTYNLLFSIGPVFISLLCLELLRHFRVRRITSQYLLHFARVMRRRPSFNGKISSKSFGEWFIMFLIVGGNILVFVYYLTARVDRLKTAAKKQKQPFELEDYLDSIGVTLGFSTIYNMAFLFIPATRNAAWLELFNVSYANGIKFHRWLGTATVLCGFLHMLSFYIKWVREGSWQADALPCFNCDFGKANVIRRWQNVFGELALLCFLCIGITSIPYVRRHYFDIFYYTHHLLFAAVIFAVMHWTSVVWWIFPTFLIYIVNRVKSNASNASFVTVDKLQPLSTADGVVKIVLARSPRRDGHYSAGNFVYINVPQISKLQWHPFTVASSPRGDPNSLTLYIKVLGDWTKSLRQYAQECEEHHTVPQIHMDGFYGGSLEMYHEYASICVIGGGIGATPMFALLDDLSRTIPSPEALHQRVEVLLSFNELSLLQQAHPLLERLRDLDPEERYIKLHIHITATPPEDQLREPIVADQRTSVVSTTNANDIDKKPQSSVRTSPFYVPLRSTAYRSFSLLVIFVIAVVSVIVLEYGSGSGLIRREAGTKYWALQMFTEIAVLFVAGAFTYLFIFFERQGKRAANTSAAEVVPRAMQVMNTSSDVHTLGDLITHYNVDVGKFANIAQILTDLKNEHNPDLLAETDPWARKRGIGVFVSGPPIMKTITHNTVQKLGVESFDVFEEEFEL